MRVKIRLYATLIESIGKRIIEHEIKGEPILRNLLYETSLSKHILEKDRVKEMYKILVNGRDIEFLQGLNTILHEGDIIDIFPPVAGGHTVSFTSSA